MEIKERIKKGNLAVFIDQRDLDAALQNVKDYETLEDYKEDILNSYQEVFFDILSEFKAKLIDEGYSEEEIEENLTEDDITFDFKEFLDLKVRTEIMLQFYGDDNLDMPSDSYGWLRWLAPSQGYKFKDFKKVLDYEGSVLKIEGTKFVGSVFAEIMNNSHVMIALTVLGKMTVEEYFALKNNEDTVKGINVPEDVVIGLFNPWVGGGSLLEIELEKPLKIKPKNIFGIGVNDDNPYGYSVNDVYGLTNDFWDTNIKVKFKKV